MEQQTEQRWPAPWRIVAYTREEDQPARYAVLRGSRRVAWGLRDEASAARWLRRLSAPASRLWPVDCPWEEAR